MFGKFKEKFRIIALIFFIVLAISAIKYNEYYVETYRSLDVDRSKVSVVEYGTANYSLKEIIIGLKYNLPVDKEAYCT